MEGVLNRKIELLTLLNKEVEETFGRRMASSRDCIQLSEEIYFKTSYKINPNTLRRFFGLVKASYPPSTSTLNILSTYCGFASFDDLLTSSVQQREAHADPHSKEFLSYIVSLFKSTSVKENDETFMSVVKQTILLLRRHPEFTDKFQRAIAKTRNGQDFYFEQFVNIDQLNSFYGDGLRYYLNEKKTPEAQVFGFSLLCFRAWLTEDEASMKKYFEEIKKIKLTKAIHPFICGRYFASHIYYADMFGLSVERVLLDAQHIHSHLKPRNDHYQNFPCFEYIFSIALLLTGHYPDALYYISHAQKNFPARHPDMDQGYYKTLLLIRGITFAKMGERARADEIFKQLRPSQFYFLSKKTNTIFYLLLGRYLHKKNQRPDDELGKLIEETGFTRINRLLTDDYK